jgi:hypothetical protein
MPAKLALVAVRAALVAALFGPACRGPDYLEVGGGYGWADEGGGSITGGNPGNPISGGWDGGGGDAQSVSLTLGWQLSGSNRDLLDRLDRLQDAMLSREPPEDVQAPLVPPPSTEPPEPLREPEGGLDAESWTAAGGGLLLLLAALWKFGGLRFLTGLFSGSKSTDA